MTTQESSIAAEVTTEEVVEREVEIPVEGRADLRIPRAFVVVAAVLLSKALLTRFLVLGDASPFSTLVLESAFVLAYLGVVDVLFRRYRLTAYLVADVVLSLLLLAVAIYASYFDRVLAFGLLKVAGQVETVRETVFSLLKPIYVLYLVDLPVLLFVGSRHRSRIEAEGQRGAQAVGWLAALSLVVAGISVLATVPSIGTDGMVVARSNGILGYQIAVVTSRPNPATPAAASAPMPAPDVDPGNPVSVKSAIDAVMGEGKTSRLADFERGAYAGANVIVIQAESMQSFPIGLAAGDAVFTPELNELVAESWYFPNGFSQAGYGTTSDAEFAMNSSLYPPEYGASSVEYVGHEIPSLPRLLRAAGYDAFTMHANTARFWNRKELYPALGFSRYYDRSFFATESVTRFGATDRAMFKMAWPEIAKVAKKGPFYCQIVTLAAHHPYNIPEKDVKIELPGWLGGHVMGNYLEAMNYGDAQIGWFVNKLKKSGLWDKSIVVIYGDHGGLREADLNEDSNRERFELILGHRYTQADMVNVPVIIHLPGQTSGVVVTDPVGQIDIMPTIADALGLDLSATPYFGRDAFESSRVLLSGRGNLPLQSFVNERTVCIAAADFGSSTGISLKSWLPTELRPEEKADWSDARAMSTLSDEYVKGLPKRESQGTLNAIIPGKK